MSKPEVSICFITARQEPRFDWFLDGLRRELATVDARFEVVLVDYFAEGQREGEGWSVQDAELRTATVRDRWGETQLVHVAPFPNVWQGPHRRAKENWFAKSNALNTAICHASADYLLMTDDVAVMMPGYLSAVVQAAREGAIACFAYDKRSKMVVEDGRLVSSEPGDPHDCLAVGCKNHHSTKDHRYQLTGGKRSSAPPEWTYGCGLGIPVEATLLVNGWPLECDSMGYEDSVFGMVVGRRGFTFVYDPRAMTVESEDDHHRGTVMRRADPGKSPNDKSHAILDRYRVARGRFGFNDQVYTSEGGLRGTRQSVQRGEVPKLGTIDYEWFTGKRVEEFDG